MSERRSNQRLKALGLSTPYGEVMNVSDSGMGVFRKGRVVCAIGDEIEIHLNYLSAQVTLKARVARIDHVGLFRHEIGFEFVDVNEKMLTKLYAMTDMACGEFTGPRCFIAA